MILIREDFDEIQTNIITESEDAGGKKNMYIEGIFMQDTLKNRNGRIYPKEVMTKAVNQYVEKFVNTKRSLGELNHPTYASVNPERACSMITSLKEDGNNWVGKAKILNTPMGSIVKNLIEDGVQLGVSSRGLGSVKESNGANVVQSDFWISAVDTVSDPSAPDAFVNGIMENKEWILENGVLVEKELEEIQEEINDLVKHRRFDNKAMESIFQKVVINL